eukprot:INCI2341.2.p1 GENE.INCI2341.2~~INCI2341.2.p1  ORF type:complete len:142 (-),score=25.69 INCI2341.2:114-509(-)
MGGGMGGGMSGGMQGHEGQADYALEEAELELDEQKRQGELLDQMVKLGFESNMSPERMMQAQMCMGVDEKYLAMCEGYAVYLSECPSFLHDICHEDVGGSELLRSPCPDYLKCYYCLRINPLYCFDPTARD